MGPISSPTGLASLELLGVEYTYSPGQLLFGPIQQRWSTPRRVGLIGPNGAGKSTLLRLLAGWQPCQSGRVLCQGAEIQQRPPELRPIHLLSGHPQLYNHWSVARNIGFPARCRKGTDRTPELLEKLQLEPLADARPYTLSTGQRQRVAWARALNREASWLLADEALPALDGEHRLRVWQLLSASAAGVILVTHQLASDLPWLDELYSLEGGQLRAVDLSTLWNDPKSLWLARQLAPSQIWNDPELLGRPGWHWVPEDAWQVVPSGQGWKALWLEQRQGGRTSVECRGQRFWVHGPDQQGDLQLLPERIRPLNA